MSTVNLTDRLRYYDEISFSLISTMKKDLLLTRGENALNITSKKDRLREIDAREILIIIITRLYIRGK